jgi:ribosome maturation factor RimP
VKHQRTEDIVLELGAPVAARLGMELVDVEYRKEGANWVLRCLIDTESGVGIDDCQQFSEALGAVLDAADPIPGRYLLEVSSPGLERPLKKDADFIRFVGREVTLKLHKTFNERKQWQGKLLGMDEAGRLIRVEVQRQVLEIPRTAVAKANLVAEFFEGDRKGSKRKK